MKRIVIPLLSLLVTLVLAASCSKFGAGDSNNKAVLCATEDASNVTATTAEISGSITIPKELEGKRWKGYLYYSSEYSDVDSLSQKGERLIAEIIPEDSNVFYSFLTYLLASTKYYYMASVKIDGKEYFGEVKSFTTRDYYATVFTLDTSEFKATQAVVKGNYSYFGIGLHKEFFFLVSDKAKDVETLAKDGRRFDSYESRTYDGRLICYYAILDNTFVKPSTTYYYVACLKVRDEFIYGEVKSFTTFASDYEARPVKPDIIIDGNFDDWDALSNGTFSEYVRRLENDNYDYRGELRLKLTSNESYIFFYTELNFDNIFIASGGPYSSGDSITGFSPSHPGTPGAFWLYLDSDLSDDSGAFSQFGYDDDSSYDAAIGYYFCWDEVREKMQFGWQRADYLESSGTFSPDASQSPENDNVITDITTIKFSAPVLATEPLTGNEVTVIKIEGALDMYSIWLDKPVPEWVKISSYYANTGHGASGNSTESLSGFITNVYLALR